eukprot:TRINITY_DN15416_c0_g1_i1.p1 TRINITY_DN15416_c0_g1~~TRINITY_DN15416_c0_g1_i1.p1  ORF type:complete len:228 (-),score=56.73 TRINITY_DN15416_c0_g1_i1:93-776(-)
MPILYSVIARDTNILAEHTNATGNFISITKVILEKISPPQEGLKKSYVYDKHIFHFMVSDGITYLCMCDDQFERRRAFAFLEDIKNRFSSQFGKSAKTARPYAMNSDFGSVLAKQTNYFSYDPSSDKITHVKQQADNTRLIMVESIEKVLQRGERIELLVDKTEQLESESYRFRNLGKKLKYAMCWKNAKMIIIIILLLLVLLWLILSLACGFTFSKCRSHSTKPPY